MDCVALGRPLETATAPLPPHHLLLRRTDVAPAQQAKVEAETEEVDTAPPVKYRDLFRYSKSSDFALLFLGVLAACGSGAQRPVSSIIFGNVINGFTSIGAVLKIIRLQCIYYCYIAAGAAVCGFIQGWTFSLLAERVANGVRTRYLEALLKTDIAFYDTASTGALSGRLTTDVALVHGAVGQKLGLFVQLFATLFTGIVIGFWYSWELTLVTLSLVPILATIGGAGKRKGAANAAKEAAADADANAVTDELFAAIRTVAAFTGERRAEASYRASATLASLAGFHSRVVTGLGHGTVQLVLFSGYCIAMWFGSVLIRQGTINGGHVMSAFFSVMISASSLGQTAPCVDAFKRGCRAAGALFEAIERAPTVTDAPDAAPPAKPPAGELLFDSVAFTYASRPDAPVFTGLTLRLGAGLTTALVGESGSGKSTCIALLLRFYDIQAGCLRFDGHDVRSLPIAWLRSQMGLVSQEPVLFATSVRDNLRYGRPDASDADLVAACTAAHAHEFIMALERGYDQQVGDRGTQLSGGQRQRLAIARAILRDPVVLLLDEATSALDNTSERAVQRALDDIRKEKKRTTVVVAHRLTTIRDADDIVVMRAGSVVERGDHDALARVPNGAYAALLAMQESSAAAGKTAALPSSGSLTALDKVTTAVTVVPADATSNGKHAGLAAVVVDAAAVKAAPDGVDPNAKPLARVFALCRPDSTFLVLGLSAAALAGGIFPVFAVIMSHILTVFFEPFNQMKVDAVFWACMFLVIGGGALVVYTTMYTCAAILAQRVGLRLRMLALHAALRQEVSFFDTTANATGALASRIAGDVLAVRLLVSDGAFAVIQNCATLTAGLVIAFVGGWQLALVMCGTLPLTLASYYIAARRLGDLAGDTRKLYEHANQVASDALANIRTVAAFGSQARVMTSFSAALAVPEAACRKQARIVGYSQAFSQAMASLPAAFSFYIGGIFIEKGIMTFQGVMQVFFALLMTAAGMSQVSAATADIGAAKPAAAALFALVDRVPAIDADSEEGLRLDSAAGEYQLRDVAFTYPARPDTRALDGVTLTIAAGSNVALVGSSGSGKSTVIQLLLRFGDPQRGGVFFDGHDVRQLNLRWLRSQLALVSQEPVLFSGTVFDNVAYGAKPDQHATLDDVRAACQAAAMAAFIDTLPDGYDTAVGSRGVQLSGGQRQRLCLARAILRDPVALLLDEATSALDNTSERAVQRALDEMRKEKRRTTVTVAHRLTTIRDADKICVMGNGKLLEEGTHEQLLNLPGGSYAALVAAREGGGH